VKGGRILWIDDRPHNIIGERRLLRALGADVIITVSSDCAEEILNRDNDFDIIITDVQRVGESYKLNNGEPIHEGVNFIVKLRNFDDPIIKSIPVVFYAAYDWDRLIKFTKPARETKPIPKISNTIEDMLSKVITVIT
jgi:CheY-like chemotaxis protein